MIVRKGGRLSALITCYGRKAAYRMFKEETMPQRAEDLWKLAGKPDGQSLEFWLRAERDFDASFGFLLK